MNTHAQQIIRVLQNIHFATIATTSNDGQPWNSPVAYYLDRELNLYWSSDKNSQHSRNIRENQHIFIVIYDSTVAEAEGEGVYILARAKELNDPEEIRLARRIKKGPENDSPETYMGDQWVRRIYKAVPEKIWINDAIKKDGSFWKDFRVEVPLSELTALLPQQSSSH